MTRVVQVPEGMAGHEVAASHPLALMIQAQAVRMGITPFQRIVVHHDQRPCHVSDCLTTLHLSATALKQPSQSLAFIVSHEMAHVKLKHRALPLPAPAFVREWHNHRMEYDADAVAAEHVPVEWGIGMFEADIQDALAANDYDRLGDDENYPSHRQRIDRLKALRDAGKVMTVGDMEPGR